MPTLVLTAIAGALVVKVVLLVWGTHAGFAACYRSLDEPGPAGCERSFANPTYRFEATRLDGAINFGVRKVPGDFTNLYGLYGETIQSTNWDLGFLNTGRFNFLPGGQAEPVRRFWPRFSVHWSGTIDVPAGGDHLRVEYAGEGVLRAGGSTWSLPASYQAMAIADVVLTPGPHAISLDYRWDLPGIPSLTAGMPLPELRLVSSAGRPVAPVPPAAGWRLLGLAGDIVAGGVALSLLVVIASRVRRAGMLVAVVAIAAAGAAVGVSNRVPDATRDVFLILAASLLVVLMVRAREFSALEFGLTAYLGLVILETARALASYGTLNMVLYRGAGQDFLTYESFARSILETGSLQAGERVFVYSPGIRYLLYGQHVLLGDGNITIAMAGVVALTLSVFLLMRRLQARIGDHRGTPWRLLLLLAVAMVVMVEAVGVDIVRAGFSEYPAWILILLSLYCLLEARSLRATAWGVALAALALTFRFDEAVGLAWLCGTLAFAWALARAHVRAKESHAGRARVFGTVAGLGVGAVAIAALPALHNLYYGHQVAFLLRTPNLPINFPIPYAKALGSLTDPRLRPVLLRQLRGVTDVAPATSAEALVSARPIFDVAVHVIQAAWLLAVPGAIRVRHRISTTGKLLLALPLAFLLPHLFIQVYVYYPRHIVAGYLAMAVAAAWVIGDLAGSGEDLSGSDVG